MPFGCITESVTPIGVIDPSCMNPSNVTSRPSSSSSTSIRWNERPSSSSSNAATRSSCSRADRSATSSSSRSCTGNASCDRWAETGLTNSGNGSGKGSGIGSFGSSAKKRGVASGTASRCRRRDSSLSWQRMNASGVGPGRPSRAARCAARCALASEDPNTPSTARARGSRGQPLQDGVRTVRRSVVLEEHRPDVLADLGVLEVQAITGAGMHDQRGRSIVHRSSGCQFCAAAQSAQRPVMAKCVRSASNP